MNGVAQDLRFACRQLLKAPGFTLTVVLTLALGIGAVTAIFSLVEGVLLRPLPFSQPDRLVLLGDDLGGSENKPVTAREIGTYSNATSVFSSLGGYIGTSYEVSGDAYPEQIHAVRLNARVFPTLGVQPILGRVFTQQEEDADQPLVVISYALWLNRFHRDPLVLGKSIDLDRKAYSIIGVMPRNFEFPLHTGRLDQAQLWVPLSLGADELSDDHAGFWGYQIIARMKNGVTFPQAAQDADRVAKQIMQSFPASMAAIHFRGDVMSLRENAVGEVQPLLRALFMAVSIVLLIACANVASLLLVRAIRRRHEIAVRLALGAGPMAIIWGSVFEGLLLSLAGGLLGLAFAAVTVRTALHLLPESMPRIDSISIDASVAGFALLLGLVTGTLCSFAPAFAALRTNVIEGLGGGMRAGTGSVSHTWLRSALVVSEIAIALVLLTVSGAFLRSFQKMRAVDPGYRPDHVLVGEYQLPLGQYSTNVSVATFNRAVVDDLSQKTGIVAVGTTNSLPATDDSPLAAYTTEGQTVQNWKLKFASFAFVDGDYFQAMGIRLLEGRTFAADDRADTQLVVIVNQSMAEHSWPGQRAVGRQMHVGNPRKDLPWATVIGVVADTKIGSRDEPNTDQWYSLARQPAILYGSKFSGRLTESARGYIAVRAGLPPEEITSTLRSSIAEIDPLLALEQVKPMEDVISDVEAPRRFNTDLITAFALGALLLAITGIYAVVAFSVSMRTNELAIRMALGAQRGGIARLVLGSSAKLALLGCGLGVLGSVAVSRFVGSFLFNVSATDPVIYAAGVVIMIVVALLASLLPAARAASADPVDSLRAS
jgi:predicted permease